MLGKCVGLIGICLAVLLLGASGAGLHREETKQTSSGIKVQVVSSKAMDKLLQQYPNAVKLVAKEKKTQSTDTANGPQTREVFTYTLSDRVSGDGLVGYDSYGYSWLEPRDVRLTLDYPASGLGAVVTYVEIVVYQSSDWGRAYVIAGGIGQRYISFVVEADYTTYFDYTSRVYGIY